MSLRERIEAKQRRTATHPILVGDPGPVRAEINNVLAAMAAVGQVSEAEAVKPAHKRRLSKLRAQLKAAQERAEACVVEIELQALPADDWEALVGPLEPDESGELDLSAIHAVALAEMCVDPELRDAEWWSLQFKQPHWSQGDRAGISRVLMDLNWSAPSRSPGKG